MDQINTRETTFVVSFIASIAAIITSLYYYNTPPEATTVIPRVSGLEKKYKRVEIEPSVSYEGWALPEKGSVEIYWDGTEDVSGWKFSDGGYFVLESGTILPSDKVQKLSGKFEWVASDKPIVIWLSDEDFIFRKKM